MKRRPAVFLDRDGTILNERRYLTDVRKMVFYAWAPRALKRLQTAGFRLVVVTNQSAIGRGYLSAAGLTAIHAAFRKRLRRAGVRIDGIFHCPHLPNAGCRCRKPGALLLERAARTLNLDLSASYVVGDQDRDVDLARAVGAVPVLVLTGAGRSMPGAVRRRAAKVTRNLETASRWIVGRARGEATP